MLVLMIKKESLGVSSMGRWSSSSMGSTMAQTRTCSTGIKKGVTSSSTGGSTISSSCSSTSKWLSILSRTRRG